MRSGLTRGLGYRLFGVALAAALAASLAGCAGSTFETLERKVKNPFSKKEVPLPGERVAVITDTTEIVADPGEGAKPVQVPAPQANAAWSQPGGSPSNSLGNLALNGDVRKVWSSDAGTGSSSSGRLSAVPLVADGKVFTLDAAGTVSAFSAASGGRIWSQDVTPENEKSKEGFGGGLALDGGRLYAATGYGTVVALDPGNGAVVIAPFPAGDVGAFEVASGKQTWRDSLARQADTSASGVLGDPARPVVDRGVVFVVSHGGKMIAIAESSGERLWTRNIAGTQMPWVAGDTVYVVDLSGKLIALARADGKVRWVSQLPGGSRWSGPVLAGSKLWLVSGEGLLVGADARTGQLLSQLDLDTPVFVAPVVAGGRMYILADNASLIALN